MPQTPRLDKCHRASHEDAHMNRAQRRATRSGQRRRANDGDVIVAFDRADLLRFVAAMVEADETVSGATVITADGDVSRVDAAMLRRGGSA
jgi:hypothetical protein